MVPILSRKVNNALIETDRIYTFIAQLSVSSRVPGGDEVKEVKACPYSNSKIIAALIVALLLNLST